MKRVLITSATQSVNGVKHLGNLVGSMLPADVFARFCRARGYETLAICAYMQPVTKGEVEGIRGVSADSVIATLVDRRFLTESGRKDVPGRPILYKTTDEFLEAFGLRSLEELPPIDLEGTSPMELALPIPTQAASAHESAFEDEPETDPETDAETATDLDRVEEIEETAAEADKTHLAPVETIVAEQETEPQPSAV